MCEKIEMEVKVPLPLKPSFEDLPPEMLMQIHGCLDLKSLFRCRGVSRRWRVIANSVCGTRAELEIQLYCYKYNSIPGGKILVFGRKKETSLREFIQLFGASKNFPCAHYRFVQVGSWTFSNADWINFFSAFGQNITCLKFRNMQLLEKETENGGRIISKVVEKLSDLLLNKGQLPNLQECGLHFFNGCEKSEEIPLFRFPSTCSTTETASKSKQCQEEKRTAKVQLSRLKILYLDEFMFSKFTRIVTDLLQASPNLRKIEPFEKAEFYKSIESFQVLEPLGKLDCIKMAEMRLTHDCLAKIRKHPAAPLAFKLNTLNLCFDAGCKSKRDLANSAVFLSNLFDSSKNTLEELTTNVVGGLQDLQMPKFSKLTNLKILHTIYGKPSDLFLPAGIQFQDTFPVLRTLDLDNPWRTIFPQDGADSDVDPCLIPDIPTLKSLRITGKEMNGKSITQISATFPNLKNFKVKHGGYAFPQVGRAIWTHMKKLECLELIVDSHTKANAFPAIDSCNLGFSLEDCLRLYDLYQLEPPAGGANFSPPKLSWNFNPNRTSPSILDLEDLKYFEICLASVYTAGSRGDLMNKTMNRIYEDYAFKFMNNFTYNIFGRR